MSVSSDEHWLKFAYKCAQRSGDLSTQNGAVLIKEIVVNAFGNPPPDEMVLAVGWNDIHPPLVDSPLRRSAKPDKYQWTEHAERSAIYAAAKKGISTEGSTLYCPWFACHDCGRAIVYAGIKRVVGHDISQHKSRPDWAESIAVADQMFKEANVEVVRLKVHLGVKFRFAGEIIEV